MASHISSSSGTSSLTGTGVNMNREGITRRIHLMIEVSKLALNKIQIFVSRLRWITTTFAGVSE
jgi:hypothetical protein